MTCKIKRFGTDRTTVFAANELAFYINKMNPSMEVLMEESFQDEENCIVIGCNPRFDCLLPDVADKTLDDAIYIDVKNGVGVITGTNERSVLIAVYRYLKELGCKFIRPGRDNEVIPQIDPSEQHVFVKEAASYRHREVCIEGACSYEHVADMIDWIPKVGMNGYFMQFVKPTGFFKVWYEHEGNPYAQKEYKTEEEYADILTNLEHEICKRGLLYSTVGHSWNCECIGIDGSYWYKMTEPVPADKIKYLAEINGKRELFGGVPVNTNLCYSNPEVQQIMTDYMIDYLKKKPYVKYLVFWLADDTGNECSCEECRKKTNGDWYFQLINLLDEKMTRENLTARIVPIIREKHIPATERIKNPSRMSMMYAPIFRDFSETYPSVIDENYLRNAIRKIPDTPDADLNILLKSTENCVGVLRTWQDVFQGDYLVYDYQMIWFHFMDPSYIFCSDVIYEDIKNLSVMGMNGMSSCQGQRVFLPTVLPMATLAQTLWDKDTEYEAFKAKTLTDEYGEDGIKVGTLLSKIALPEMTRKMSGPDALDWEKTKGEATINLITPKYAYIDELKALIEKNLNREDFPDAVRRSWEYLSYYPQIAKYYMDVWIAAFGEANLEKTRKIAVEMVDYVMKSEAHIHRVFDGCLFRRRIYNFFNTHRLPGVVLDL